MDDKKLVSYTISWKQPYNEYELLLEQITEIKVEQSELTEARNALAAIMAL